MSASFPRFEVMRDWHEQQAIPIDSFVIADGLHMNDWGYACFAQLLGDDIIKSVGQIKLGINVPAERAGLSANVRARGECEAAFALATGRRPHAFSSASCRSSIRSSRCSRPAEKRMKPSLIPSSARASGVSR